MSKKIVIAGSILVDKINTISVYPKSGELTQINGLSQAVGGCVPNVAIDIKNIDKDIYVYASGKIGQDSDGEYVKKIFAKYNVDTSKLVETKRNTTSFTNVMSINGGERTFFTYAGASSDFGLEDIDFENFNADYLHLGYFLLLKKIDEGDGLKILMKAKQKGIKTSIDLVSENSDRYNLVIPCLKYVDNLIINEIEAGNITGLAPTKDNIKNICEKLMNYGVNERVIIHMPEYAVCMKKNNYIVVPSYDLPNGYIKGATGAGDAFCAGSLVGIMKGYSEKEILEFSSACSVLALSVPDAISGLKPEKEIREFCKKFNRKRLMP